MASQAALGGHLDTVEWLLGLGVDVNKGTRATALDCAYHRKHRRVADVLLRHGAVARDLPSPW